MPAYANASIVGPDRVVFNIKRKSYRLVSAINYRHRIIFIKWTGSHADYDKIDVKTVRYGNQPIRNEGDYQRPLRRIEELWHSAEGSAESDELDVVTTLVEV